jgi:transcription antitermination factor NusA-like protein
MYGNPTATNRGANGTYQIRVLIPKAAASYVIGKSGAEIKRMSELSGSKIQLGEESDPFNTKERTVTFNSQTVRGSVLVI